MKKTFKRQMAVIFGAIAIIGYLSVRSFPAQEQSISLVIPIKDEAKHTQIYMMDGDKTLIPLSVPVSGEMSEEGRLALMFSYMSGKQGIKGFTLSSTEEYTLQSPSIKSGIVSLYFDDSLKNYDKESELCILEAITQGATQFHGIEQVKLYLNDEQLTSTPNVQTPIPEILNRNISINHLETPTTTSHGSASLTVFYTKKVRGNEYMAPKSRRVAQSQGNALKVSAENILSNINVSSVFDQPLCVDDTKISSFDVYDGSLVVSLNRSALTNSHTVKRDMHNALVLSLVTLPDVEKVEVRMDGVTVPPKDQKKDMVSVYALTYNEIQFWHI